MMLVTSPSVWANHQVASNYPIQSEDVAAAGIG